MNRKTELRFCLRKAGVLLVLAAMLKVLLQERQERLLWFPLKQGHHLLKPAGPV